MPESVVWKRTGRSFPLAERFRLRVELRNIRARYKVKHLESIEGDLREALVDAGLGDPKDWAWAHVTPDKPLAARFVELDEEIRDFERREMARCACCGSFWAVVGGVSIFGTTRDVVRELARAFAAAGYALDRYEPYVLEEGTE